MGFLDNSTNNIVLDAVLTNEGRRRLASNDGSFRIAFFSLGDSEVDYTTIPKFGRTVGKEKISKNTPIAEAQTNGDLANKYRLVSLPDGEVKYLPTMALVTAASALSFQKDQQLSLSVKTSIVAGQTVPNGLRDKTFTVQMRNRFLQLAVGNPFNVSAANGIASYSVQASDLGKIGTKTISIVLQAKSLAPADFSTYGTAGAIRTVVSFIGNTSGLRHDAEITITQT